MSQKTRNHPQKLSGLDYFLQGMGGALGFAEDYFEPIYEEPVLLSQKANIASHWSKTNQYLVKAFHVVNNDPGVTQIAR